MQQLLGDRSSATDEAFLRELFVQRLPANVRMVLASTSDTISVGGLAELADKIMDAASLSPPPLSAIKAPSPQADTIDQLRAEVAWKILPLSFTHIPMS